MVRGRGCRVSSYQGLQFLSKKSFQNAHCTCGTIRSEQFRCEQILPNRQISTSKAHRCESRLTELFDAYYEAVVDAHKSNENLILYKYKALSDNPKERDIQLKKWMFTEAVDIYVNKTDSPHQSGLRRGHIEFIRQALQRMNELGLQRELDCYKALLKVFPTDVMVPTTVFQVEFYHFPKQQDTVLEILEQMEDNAVIPDQNLRDILEARFGKDTHVIRKVRRMIYWFRKFQNLNPYKLPHYLPLDPIELAILALNKMAVDLENEIKVFKVTEQGEQSFIASAQSPTQRELIRKHPKTVPLYVEGGYLVWLRDTYQTYYILRADSDPKIFQYPTKQEEEDNLDFETIFDSEEPKDLVVKPNVHQQEDGTVLGMCITENGTKDSLISWIRCLQEDNPSLENIPVVFSVQTPEEVTAPVPVEEKEDRKGQFEASK